MGSSSLCVIVWSAQVTEGTSRTDVLKDLFKRKKETTEPGIKPGEYKSQFKIVANKRESLLSHEGNPAGWVNRTAEKEEMAKHGSEWRSDAFIMVRLLLLIFHSFGLVSFPFVLILLAYYSSWSILFSFIHPSIVIIL
ncbi:hypothetical protein BYT27DRAFT_6375940 [Phlegmacium glaucopus]|nr:hypothetical protein BYT27DRAFT_6375940 [Phlegmacium glaucopus]